MPIINKTKPANCIGLKLSSDPLGLIYHGIKKKAHTKTVLTVSTTALLCYEEIKEGFNKFYGENKISEKEFNEIINAIDKDKNNCIEYEEFISSTINLDMLLSDKYLHLAFDSYDKDGSQLLSVDEIKKALGIIEGEDNDVIKGIIKEIDLNGDGEISFDEFKQLMLKVVRK